MWRGRGLVRGDQRFFRGIADLQHVFRAVVSGQMKIMVAFAAERERPDRFAEKRKRQLLGQLRRNGRLMNGKSTIHKGSLCRFPGLAQP